MKYLLLGIIKLYQMIPGFWHNQCRHYPTCSNYAIEAITTHGSVKGSILAFKRICRCNIFVKPSYDPVKKGEFK